MRFERRLFTNFCPASRTTRCQNLRNYNRSHHIISPNLSTPVSFSLQPKIKTCQSNQPFNLACLGRSSGALIAAQFTAMPTVGLRAASGSRIAVIRPHSDLQREVLNHSCFLITPTSLRQGGRPVR